MAAEQNFGAMGIVQNNNHGSELDFELLVAIQLGRLQVPVAGLELGRCVLRLEQLVALVSEHGQNRE